MGPPKTDRSWWRGLTKHGPLRREQQTTSVFLPWEPHEQYESESEVAQSCPTLCDPMDNVKRPKDITLKDEFPRLVDAQYATGEERRNSSRRNEEAEPKWTHCPLVDVSGGESHV